MAPWKTPKDLLLLGKTISKELDLDEDNDTLSKWMAHHLSELITQAERAAPGEAKKKLEKEAAQTIIKLWENRAAYGRGINPLSDLVPAIKTLKVLSPDIAGIFGVIGGKSSLSNLFESFRQLLQIVILFQSEQKDLKKLLAKAAKTTKFQNDQEKYILSALSAWLNEKHIRVLLTIGEVSEENEKLTDAFSARLQDVRQGLISLEREFSRRVRMNNADTKI